MEAVDAGRPAKGETPDRTETSAQIGVLAARFRDGRAEFGEGQCAEQREQSADNPGGKDDGHGAAFTSHFGGFQKNAGTDHGADDNRRGGPGAEATDKLETLFGRRGHGRGV